MKEEKNDLRFFNNFDSGIFLLTRQEKAYVYKTRDVNFN